MIGPRVRRVAGRSLSLTYDMYEPLVIKAKTNEEGLTQRGWPGRPKLLALPKAIVFGDQQTEGARGGHFESLKARRLVGVGPAGEDAGLRLRAPALSSRVHPTFSFQCSPFSSVVGAFLFLE